jgi:hypothetical protein
VFVTLLRVRQQVEAELLGRAVLHRDLHRLLPADVRQRQQLERRLLCAHRDHPRVDRGHRTRRQPRRVGGERDAGEATDDRGVDAKRLLQLDQARRLERVLATEQVAHHVVAVARAHRPPLRVASQRVLERVRPHQAVEVVVGADPVCRGLALRDAAS